MLERAAFGLGVKSVGALSFCPAANRVRVCEPAVAPFGGLALQSSNVNAPGVSECWAVGVALGRRVGEAWLFRGHADEPLARLSMVGRA